jgi:hypothetical protein
MRFESRSLWIAKDTEMPQCYEDAFCLDAERGAAAIADGVSEGIFSGPWARILTETVVAEPPNLNDPAEFQAWLAQRRTTWAGQIDTSRLAWYQRPKLIDGGMSTLLWLTLWPNDGQGDCPNFRLSENGTVPFDSKPGSYLLETFAIGDCCLFHVREGNLIRSFPLQSAAEFDLTPGMIGSVDQKRDHLLEFKTVADVCLPGDLLALCTDALAQWALGRSDAGSPVDWERYWEMPAESWQEEIAALRRDRQMRYDDTTLLLLRVVEEKAASSDAIEVVELETAEEDET